MTGPCLCGDPCCPSCGNPELARMEEVFNAISEDADRRRFDHVDVAAVWAMGCAAFAAVKAEAAWDREPGWVTTNGDIRDHVCASISARLVPVPSPNPHFRFEQVSDTACVHAWNGDGFAIAPPAGVHGIASLVEWINLQLAKQGGGD